MCCGRMRCCLAQLSSNQNALLRQLPNSSRKRVDGTEKLMRRSSRITENRKGGVRKERNGVFNLPAVDGFK